MFTMAMKWLRAGLNIEKYIKSISKQKHRLKPNGVHTGKNSWNAMWRRFIADNPIPKRNKIRDQLKKMMRDFGVGGKQ